MSGLEKIIEQIEQDAKETAQSHLNSAQEKADKIIAEADDYVQKELDKYSKVLEEKRNSILSRTESSCELETRKTVLKVKQELIAAVLVEAKAKLENLEPSEYFEVLSKLAVKYSGVDKLEMKLGDKDIKRVPEDFSSKLPKNIALSKESANINSGFVLVGNEIDENCSFDALFADNIEQLQDKASSILFK